MCNNTCLFNGSVAHQRRNTATKANWVLRFIGAGDCNNFGSNDSLEENQTAETGGVHDEWWRVFCVTSIVDDRVLWWRFSRCLGNISCNNIGLIGGRASYKRTGKYEKREDETEKDAIYNGKLGKR